MKTIVHLFICFALLYLMQSCCKPITCSGFEEISQINLYNFTDNEVSKIEFKIYDENNVLIQTKSTKGLNQNTANNMFAVSIPEVINKSHKYVLFFSNISGTSNKDSIYDFELSTQKCKCPGDSYQILSGYKVNNNTQSTTELYIQK